MLALGRFGFIENLQLDRIVAIDERRIADQCGVARPAQALQLEQLGQLAEIPCGEAFTGTPYRGVASRAGLPR